MTTKIFAIRAIVVCTALCAVTASPLRAGSLETAKALYAGASYEEALKELASYDASANPNEIDQYRALCLLALGRTGEVRRSLESIVARSPLYALNASEVSPVLVEMYRDIRRRTLPATARARYADGKAAYDAKEYSRAAGHFREVLAIAGDLDAQGEALGDVKQLAEGFLTLADAAIAAAAPPPPAAVESAPAPAAPVTAEPAMYTADDTDVIPPGDIQRPMPPWRPPSGRLVITKLRGSLEVVVNERGEVESAKMRREMWAPYDAQLLEAARSWKFSPATKNGAPVKYLKVLDIVLNPPSWHE